MVKIGQKTWITEIQPAVRTACTELLNSSPHDPLPTAAQPSLGNAFYYMAVSVLVLLTDATNLNKRHRPVNTILVVCLSKKAYEADKINKFGFEHLKHYV